jgi:hypothetical protein
MLTTSLKSTWSSKQVCQALRMSVGTLRTWVVQEVIRPYHKGRTRGGPGGGDRFSVRQLLALGLVTGMCRQARGCKLEWARTLIARFEEVSDAAVEAFISDSCQGDDSLRQDYDEEAMALFCRTLLGVPLAPMAEVPEPGTNAQFDILNLSFERAVTAVRARRGLPPRGSKPKGPQPGRMSPKARAAARKKKR